MTKSKYDVQVLVDGKPVREYSKDNKVFVESKHGTQYSIRVKNNTGKRVLAVISVDGINVITGEISKPDSTGYVLNGYSSETIQGYRQNDETGGRFKFTAKSPGYSKEIDGTGVNSGVIGVLFVEEQEKPQPIKEVVHHHHYHEKDPVPSWPRIQPTWIGDDPYRWGTLCKLSSTSGSGASAKGSDLLRSCSNTVQNYCADSISTVNTVQAQSLNFCSVVDNSSQDLSLNIVAPKQKAQAFDSATTWGESFTEALHYVEFTRSSRTEKVDIYYATRDSLKSLGVIKDEPPAVNFPQSFPGFAKPPANWNQ